MDKSTVAKAPRQWTRKETLDLLDVLRTSCIDYLDGTQSNHKGELYHCVEQEMRIRNPTCRRDARQIENKWRNLKAAYDRHKRELETGYEYINPCEYLAEMDDLYLSIANRSLMSATVETIATEEDVSYFENEMLVEESQDFSIDEDAVVIEEIVYDSQDALEFDEAIASSSTPKPTPKRKKLTSENMEALLTKLSNMQKELDEAFIRKQMELIENEFEAFREKEKEHWSQLKLDLEELKEKYLDRIRQIARGERTNQDATDETVVPETKRRRTVGGTPSKRK